MVIYRGDSLYITLSRESVVGCTGVLFLRSMPLCIIMMITIAAITATATAMTQPTITEFLSLVGELIDVLVCELINVLVGELVDVLVGELINVLVGELIEDALLHGGGVLSIQQHGLQSGQHGGWQLEQHGGQQ